jgi:hypothetical protein
MDSEKLSRFERVPKEGSQGTRESSDVHIRKTGVCVVADHGCIADRRNEGRKPRV